MTKASKAVSAFALLSLLFVRSASAQSTPEWIKSRAVEIKAPDQLPADALASLSRYKLITVGEMHGTHETPQFVLGLAKLLVGRGLAVLLAVEIDEENQADIDRFVSTGDIQFLKSAPFFRRPLQDGRSSEAMAQLLSGVRSLNGLRIVCFDPKRSSNDQERDRKMAENIRKAHDRLRPDIIIALAGNIHASLVKGTPWNADFRPMGVELLTLPRSPFTPENTLAVKQRYLGGSAWVCLQGKPCEATTFKDFPTVYSDAVGLRSYFLLDEKPYEGYGATFFVRMLTASAPLVSDLGK